MKSIFEGPLIVNPLPSQVEKRVARAGGGNADIILSFLDLIGVVPAMENVIVDIGLPSESFKFAEKGFSTESFEARQAAFEDINQKRKEMGNNAGDLIHLHNVALSNQSGTAQFFDAADSGSLLETAVIGETALPEKKKFVRSGSRMENVTLARLDSFATKAVAMKIDTQGAEPEIFMGAEKLFRRTDEGPFIIVTEFCSRLRPMKELLIGIHLLRGLGYKCHSREKEQEPFILNEDTQYCDDFVCTRLP